MVLGAVFTVWEPTAEVWPIAITHQLVLIGCDGGEDGLNEDEGAELLRLEIEQ